MTDDEKLTREKILDKVRKLMALAEGSTFEGETATALARARDLLAKYNLSMSDVEREAYNEESPIHVHIDVQDGYWQAKLGLVIAGFTNTVCYLGGGRGRKRIYIMGMEHEVEVGKYMFVHIARQIDKMMRKYRRELRDERERMGYERQNARETSHHTRGYVLGIIARLKERLDERLAQESDNTCTALVLHKHPKVIAFEDSLGIRRRRERGGSNAAYEQGKRDGNKITINQGIAHRKSPERKQLS